MSQEQEMEQKGETVREYLRSMIRECDRRIQTFRDNVAKGTPIDYIAQCRIAPAIGAEERLKILCRLERAEDIVAKLDETIQELEGYILRQAEEGTHRSTCQWANAVEEVRLSAIAALAIELKNIQAYAKR